MRDIRKSFLGVEVLHGVGLVCEAGEIHAVVGENGAGKSTLIRDPRRGLPIYASTGRTWRMTGDERLRCYIELREHLRPVCDHGAERGVQVAIEPLVRYETSVINTVEQALELVDPLPQEGCGLLVDTYHANVEEKDFGGAFRLAGDRLVHVHASANDRGAPGADHLDWPAFRAGLRDAGYDGPVVIESFTAEDQTIATAASVWRPLARDQDTIAVDGLAFLRELLA